VNSRGFDTGERGPDLQGSANVARFDLPLLFSMSSGPPISCTSTVAKLV